MRTINWEEKLSDEDREWASQRDWLAPKIAENDAKFGDGGGKQQESPEDELARLEGEVAERQNRIAALRTEMGQTENVHMLGNPATGTGFVDNTPVDDEAPEGAPDSSQDDYETSAWTAERLRRELARRNESRVEDGLEPLSTSGTKAELIEKLRQDDRELADSDSDRG